MHTISFKKKWVWEVSDYWFCEDGKESLKFVLRGGIGYKIIIESNNSYHVQLFNTKILLHSFRLENWKGI